MKKDFLSILDLTRDEILEVFSLTDSLKSNSMYRPLEGKSAAMIFQKPSLRTRVSFEVGIFQLGGHPVFLSQEGIGIGVREKASDVGRLLSRYTSLIVARLYDHSILLELARNSTIPVVNALTDLSHPCQVLADAYTLFKQERFNADTRVVFIGDGNNIVNSWLELATLFPFHFVLAVPDGYHPDPGILKQAREAGRSTIEITGDPVKAARNADVLYTDVWISMGQENEAETRRKAFKGFQLNASLLSLAKPDCLVMHCLPAHRDEEITDEVLEGSHSVVFDQAENRLHLQKAILAKLLAYQSNGKAEQALRTLTHSSSRIRDGKTE